ncbi:MAG: exodeoxyribonuclease VII large subunit [Anaerolineales bacterium]
MSQLTFSPPSPWTVTDITQYLRQMLEKDSQLQDLWVEGEVSNLSKPSSGHLYFTLKDEGASLRCVMWRSTLARQQFIPSDGEAILVHGLISIYPPSGQYQLYADVFHPLGEGALYLEFLQLKAKLEAEGLFELERKRPIPRWPQQLGVVTSATGAAIRDILNTLARRYPLVRVIISPAAVQGSEAPESIATALESLNASARPDVILVSRGGGSLEDLAAFNTEQVARAILASAAPVITGIGHETDFTIADFVADLRAPTPTAAAEMATPDQAELRVVLQENQNRLNGSMKAYLETVRWRVDSLKQSLKYNAPVIKIRYGRQQIDELSRRSETALAHRFRLKRTHLQGLHQNLLSLNPKAILQRGYAVVTQASGALVRQVGQVRPGEDLQVHVSDGGFGVRVRDTQTD